MRIDGEHSPRRGTRIVRCEAFEFTGILNPTRRRTRRFGGTLGFSPANEFPGLGISFECDDGFCFQQ